MMKQKVLSALLLLGILITGCGSTDGRNAETLALADGSEELSEQSDAAEKNTETESVGNNVVEATNETESDAETVEYSYEERYLRVEIPGDWDYEIKTAEDLAKEDGLVICAIDFWAEEYPDEIFTLAYQNSVGMCGTGVTIEEFTLVNGLSGYRYTETIGDEIWFTITLSNPAEQTTEGTYLITASPETAVWDTLEPEFEQILDSVRVGAVADTEQTESAEN